MNGSSNLLVFWILGPLFLGVGLYLVWYSSRRRKMLESFAREQDLHIRPEYSQEIEDILNKCFSLEQSGLTRSFGQLSNVIYDDTVWIFRAVELLDLDPYSQPQSTHFNRIAALFPVTESAHDEFFVLDKHMRANAMGPNSLLPDLQIVSMTKQIWRSCHARHPLSVTLARGYGLIYFEPFVVGEETKSDVTSLCCIGKSIHGKLTGNADSTDL